MIKHVHEKNRFHTDIRMGTFRPKPLAFRIITFWTESDASPSHQRHNPSSESHSSNIIAAHPGGRTRNKLRMDSVGENKPDSGYSCYFHFVKISSLRKVALETKKRSTSTTRRAAAMMRRFDVEPRSTILSSPAT